MGDIEGMREALELLAIPTRVLFDILGFAGKGLVEDARKGAKTVIKAPKDILVGSVKSIRTHKERQEFLRGGEATCEEIFKEKGSLPDQVDTIDNIKSWDSKEGQAFIEACEEAHVKIAPLNSKPVSFMYHSSDADKLAVGYNKLIELADGNEKAAKHTTQNTAQHYDGLDDLETRDKEIVEIVKEKEEEYLAKLSPEEVEILSQEQGEYIKQKVLEQTKLNSKNLRMYEVATRPENFITEDKFGFLALPTSKGVALLPEHNFKKSTKQDLLEVTNVFIDPEQSYPFKDANGNTNTISGKDLQRELEDLEKLKDKQMKLLGSKNKTVNDNVVLGKDMGGKTSKMDALGIQDSMSEHLSRGDFKPPVSDKGKSR